MDALLLGLYALIVWLIFFKFKWLRWTKTAQVIVFTIPVVALSALILTLNVVAPSTQDVRVMARVLQVIPAVRGRIVEIPVEGNRHYKKGEVLFRIDPTPFESTVRQLEVRLKADDASLAQAEASARQLSQSARGAAGKVAAAQARLALARQRAQEQDALLTAGAGDKFARDDARARVHELEGELTSSQASEGEAKQKLSARSEGEFASVAAARAKRAETEAQLDNARWELEQTVYRAPADGQVTNLQVSVGTMLSTLPLAPAFAYVLDEQELIAFYGQNELYKVAPNDLAEAYLPTQPGQIIKLKVDSIVWAQAQGQIQQGGALMNTSTVSSAPSRFAVKLVPRDGAARLDYPVGAVGAGAIYTQHGKAVHVMRMVFLRVSSKLNYFVFKLH